MMVGVVEDPCIIDWKVSLVTSTMEGSFEDGGDGGTALKNDF
jgi:hypothetical protein